MDQEEIIVEELEDGELSDTSNASNDYTPLERPPNYAVEQQPTRFAPAPIESESEEELQSSESEDSDTGAPKVKKVKKPKLIRPSTQSSARKKYDIWSTRVQEDVLAETLNSCDVTKKDRSRDVETYDYTMGAKYYNNEERFTNKRSRSDRKNVHLRLGKRNKSSDSNKSSKGKKRNILDLKVTMDNSLEEIAKDIANKLFEEKEDLILNVLKVVGKEKCFKLFNETRKIEKDGGMLIMNQTRRRTPGGVFLFLVRHDGELTHQQVRTIFDEERQKHKSHLKKKQKQKLDKLKQETAAAQVEMLPVLLKKAEVLGGLTKVDKSEDEDVVNPPPTPETDGLENSGDGMENATQNNQPSPLESCRAKLQTYDEDFLDINCTNDMDLF